MEIYVSNPRMSQQSRLAWSAQNLPKYCVNVFAAGGLLTERGYCFSTAAAHVEVLSLARARQLRDDPPERLLCNVQHRERGLQHSNRRNG